MREVITGPKSGSSGVGALVRKPSRSPLPHQREPSALLRPGKLLSSRYGDPSEPAARTSRSAVMVRRGSADVSVSLPSLSGSWVTYSIVNPPPGRGEGSKTD